jgi:hypothetical protein
LLRGEERVRPLKPADITPPVTQARAPQERQERPKTSAKPQPVHEIQPAAPQEQTVTVSGPVDGEITLFSRSAEMAQEPQPITRISDSEKPVRRAEPRSGRPPKAALEPPATGKETAIQSEEQDENAEKPKRRRRRRRKTKPEGSASSPSDIPGA